MKEELDKRSKDSAAMVGYWDTVDAVIGGVSTMRAAGETFLKRFAEEDNKSYAFRLENTRFTNLFKDICEGLSSKPFEEKISIVGETVPPEIELLIENIDGRGNSLTSFASDTFFNGVKNAIDWIMVDFPNVDTTIVKTLKDEQALGVRPYWSHVLARNILDIKSKIIMGAEILTYIKILEPGETMKVREFTCNDVGQIEWKLSEKNKKNEWVEIESGILSIGVIPLVPFATGRRDGASFRYDPAMSAALDLQIELYLEESGLKYIKTLTAYPMLAGNGVTPDTDEQGRPKKLNIGPNTVLYAPIDGSGNSGTWAFVEPSGASLTSLAADVKVIKEDLRELGRQPLTAQSGNVTVITSAVAAGKAKTAVEAWALTLQNALENAFKITMMWSNSATVVRLNVYTEFDTFLNGDNGLDHLREMRNNGDLSAKTLIAETKRRRVLSDDVNYDNEMELILAETPSGET